MTNPTHRLGCSSAVSGRLPVFRFPQEIRAACGVQDAGPHGDADFVFSSGGQLIHGRRDRALELPSLAEAGPDALARAVADELSRHPAGIVCGVVPFERDARPHMFLVEEPVRVRTPQLPQNPNTHATAPTHAPADFGDDAHYRMSVEAALDAIHAGTVDKVVLARHVDVPGSFDAGHTWWRGLAANPTAHGFAVSLPDGMWVGASPEMIGEVEDDTFSTHPLAGSCPRAAGDRGGPAHGGALLTSPKDQREHRFVVDHIVQNLAPLARRIDLPLRPDILATDSMLHLGTHITGVLRPHVDALRTALTIHPTPAVCGAPSADAAAMIRECEPEPRGAYAGLVGWSDANGNGQWALALRCARLGTESTRLFAGAGVVQGSTPDHEHAETAAKLGTMSLALSEAASAPAVTTPFPTPIATGGPS